jgi:GT2 family glycosyltransferase
MTARADIVIVNWNSRTLLAECVASTRDFADGVGRVIVVDNGSTDGSEVAVEGVQGVELIRAGRNLGFAAACNLGAARADAPYILFLNPDARLLAAGLPQALRFLASDAGRRYGICGARILGEDGTVQRHCSRNATPGIYLNHALGLSKLAPRIFRPQMMLEFDHLSSRQVEHCIGAWFLVRSGLFRQLGGFDERFFVYAEEMDLALRAAQAGQPTYYLSEASAYHKGGGVSEQVRAHRRFYADRSRILYAFKHFSPAGAILTLFTILILELISRFVFALLRLSWADFTQTLRGYGMLYRDLPHIFSTIRRQGKAPAPADPNPKQGRSGKSNEAV